MTVPAPVTTRASLPPPDPGLPALTTLLDAGPAAHMLERVEGVDPAGVRIVSVRYKPARRLVVEYRTARGLDAVALLDAKGDLHRLAGRPGVTWDAELGCLVQLWPNDAALPALSLPATELAGRLGIDPATGAERLGYKPFTRATLRVGAHVVKLYASDEKWGRAANALERIGRAGLARPSPVRPDAAIRATVQPLVEGGQPEGNDAARPAGALLRRFHALDPAGLPRREPAARLEEAERAARLVATLLPGLAERTQTLLTALTRTVPGARRLVVAHGDFEPGQLVASEAGLAVVDVDDLCAAPAADDLGRYAAHAVRGDNRDTEALRTAIASLVDGYGSCPAGLDWYIATSILARAASPFRRQHPAWPQRVEAFLAVAEEVVEGI